MHKIIFSLIIPLKMLTEHKFFVLIFLMAILTISYKKIAASNFISYVFHCFVNFLCISLFLLLFVFVVVFLKFIGHTFSNINNPN